MKNINNNLDYQLYSQQLINTAVNYKNIAVTQLKNSFNELGQLASQWKANTIIYLENIPTKMQTDTPLAFGVILLINSIVFVSLHHLVNKLHAPNEFNLEGKKINSLKHNIQNLAVYVGFGTAVYVINRFSIEKLTNYAISTPILVAISTSAVAVHYLFKKHADEKKGFEFIISQIKEVNETNLTNIVTIKEKLDRDKTRLKDENTQLKDENTQLKGKNTQLSNAITELETTARQLNNDKNQAENANKELKTTIQNLEKEVSLLKNTLEIKEGAKKLLLTDKNRLIEQTKKIQPLQEQVLNYEKEIKELKHELKTASEEIACLSEVNRLSEID